MSIIFYKLFRRFNSISDVQIGGFRCEIAFQVSYTINFGFSLVFQTFHLAWNGSLAKQAISVKRRCVKVDGHETTPTQCLTLLLYRSARMDGSGVAAKRTDEFAERLPACLLLNRSIT
ncbi:hypothetical protein T02_8044 [Trichinella nativa]|uniref:Uncharacterized protein n=1 Tax=Trichinella nativa TaxID=6335 RepID=A0A0V1L1X7_9BILA|nr:hypothetical protein T06_7529 [Trichinella sp. T6]KRZ53054.1 hypothetical protein T02_8044 [Trichinella nativa]